MKRYLYLLLTAILFCGMGGMTSCSDNDDTLTYEELFENEMTAALADAQTAITATGVISSTCGLTS